MFLFGKNILSLFISGEPQQTQQVLAIAFKYLSIMAAMLWVLYFLYVYRSCLLYTSDVYKRQHLPYPVQRLLPLLPRNFYFLCWHIRQFHTPVSYTHLPIHTLYMNSFVPFLKNVNLLLTTSWVLTGQVQESVRTNPLGRVEKLLQFLVSNNLYHLTLYHKYTKGAAVLSLIHILLIRCIS